VSPFVLLGLVLALLALVYVLYPIFGPSRADVDDRAQLSDVDQRRRVLYHQILEVEFDQQVGKIDQADARELTERLLRQAASLVADESKAHDNLEAEIEREILAVRRAMADERQAQVGLVKS
jgi:hypothetical protein